MKVTTFLLLLCIFSAHATGVHSQNAKVTIQKNNATLEEILNEIEKQTDYLFVYTDNVDVKEKASVNVMSAKVRNVLRQLLADKQVKYSMEGNHIVLFAEKQEVEAPQQSSTITVKGSVVDENGLTVPGANVVVKGNNSIGAVTDLDGNFTLNVPKGSTLVVSFIGYKNYEVAAVLGKALVVKLVPDAEALDEVVVVGFGSQKKVNLTGAVSSVKMDDVLGNRPVSSAIEALESSVPGLQINKVSGKPGVSINTNIRGVTSINGGSPLVLVDNVPMNLELVDPNDIETVSVLKDAAASAIYGARAAYGVILVTTKQGKKDQPVRVTYNNNFSFSKIASKYDMVTPRQTLNYFKDLGVQTYWSGQDLDIWYKYMDEYESGQHPEGYVWGDDGYRYDLAQTNAYEDMLDNFGFQQTHNIAVSGGGNKSTYRISFGMVDEDGILVTDKDKYTRYNASAFVSMDAAKWLTAQLDTKYTNSQMSTATGSVGNYNLWGTIGESTAMTPLGYGTRTKDDDVLYPYSTPRHAIELNDPKINRTSNIRLLGRLILTPLKGWNITGEYTYNRNWRSERLVNKHVETLDPNDLGLKKINSTTSYSMSNSFDERNVINIFSSYQHTFAETHDFSVMAGFNQEEYHYEYLYGRRTDMIDQDLPSLGLSTGEMTSSDAFSELALRSLFFRVNYAYKNRYLLEANGRYDGSSRFPKNNRFGFFPSFSGAWRLSEEPFMENTRQYVDNVKIRASWGNIGNQNTGGYYPYLPTMDTNRPKWILPGTSDWVTSLTTPGLVSSTLTWEKVSTFDVGLDFTLLGRLNFTSDYYVRNTKNMLGPSAPLPSVLGTSAPKTNTASLRTKGWELSLEWKDKIGKDITYRLGVNLYDSTSEITEYYDSTNGLLTNGANQSLRKGMKFGEIWGYETDRYLTVDDFEADGTLKKGPDGKPLVPLVQGQKVVYPGDIIFVDRDKNGEISVGDNTIDNPGDQIIIGNNAPRYQYGITAGITYKNFDLSLFFNGVGKRDMWLPLFPANGSYVKGIQTYQLDHWTEENPNAFYPRISEKTSTGSNYSRQSKYVRDGSYFRMKNLTLGYNVPKVFLQKYGVQNLRFFFSGENLFTIHHLPDGYMPDAFDTSVGSLSMASAAGGDSVSGFYTYPMMKQFSFGFNLTF